MKILASDSRYDKYLLEALLVTFGSGHPNLKIHQMAMKSADFNLRCIAVRALSQTPSVFHDLQAIINKATKDPHGRVRLEALIAASQLSGLVDLNTVLGQLPDDAISKDPQLSPVIDTLKSLSNNQKLATKEEKISVPKQPNKTHLQIKP